jgi:hypothetical protein
VELGGEADLEVPEALRLAVLGQLERRPFQCFLVLEDRDGVAEAWRYSCRLG